MDGALLREAFAGPLVWLQLTELRRPKPWLQAGATLATLWVLFFIGRSWAAANGSAFFLGMLIGVNAGFFLAALRGALVLARERELQTMDMLLVTPQSELSIAVQSAAGVFLRTLLIVDAPFILLMIQATIAGYAPPIALLDGLLATVTATALGAAIGVGGSAWSPNGTAAVVATVVVAISVAWTPLFNRNLFLGAPDAVYDAARAISPVWTALDLVPTVTSEGLYANPAAGRAIALHVGAAAVLVCALLLVARRGLRYARR